MEGLILMVLIWVGAYQLDPEGAFGGGRELEVPPAPIAVESTLIWDSHTLPEGVTEVGIHCTEGGQ